MEYENTINKFLNFLLKIDIMSEGRIDFIFLTTLTKTQYCGFSLRHKRLLNLYVCICVSSILAHLSCHLFGIKTVGALR